MKDLVSFDLFNKLDLRVGRIEKVEVITGIDRLYKLTVNFGLELGQRVVLSGIRNYSIEELMGRKAVFVYNLEPKKVKGVVSEGMLLAACVGETEEGHGVPVFVIPERDVPEGTLVH